MIKRSSFFGSMTARLIWANVIVFLLFYVISLFVGMDILIQLFAIQPASIISGQKLWTLFTSFFLHIQIWHLAANMFSLYFLGSFVERLIGSRRFLFLYLISGIFAGLFWSVLSGFFTFTPILERMIGNPMIFGVGASGAIFAMIGFLAVITPRAKVFLIAGPIIAIIISSVIQSALLGSQLLSQEPISTLFSIFEIAIFIYTFVALFALMSFNPRYSKIALPMQLEMRVLPFIAIIPLVIVSIFIDLPIGNMAHLGGMLCGMFYATYIKRKFPKKSKAIMHMFK